MLTLNATECSQTINKDNNNSNSIVFPHKKMYDKTRLLYLKASTTLLRLSNHAGVDYLNPQRAFFNLQTILVSPWVLEPRGLAITMKKSIINI